MPPTTRHSVVLQEGPRWLHFGAPRRVVSTRDPAEVRPLLSALAQAVEVEGLYAAGFLSYEAAPGVDLTLAVKSGPVGLPLLWFGLYDPPDVWEMLPAGGAYHLSAWTATQALPAYRQAIAQIKEAIARGETYQVNYTFPLTAEWQGDAWGLFCDLAATQRGCYAAFVDLGEAAICSASPELFFRLDGEALLAKPMKGTARRGRTLTEDRNQRAALLASTKDQAENIMIVDMIRNDLGRVAEVGSVRAPALLQAERYPTLWQMTSTVEARSAAPLDRVLGALFPCASITGAPKVRTMQWIACLEAAPRGVYTGAIGYLAPQRRAQFNVAIRTVVVERTAGRASYGVGSGIVWDSDADAEYAECLLKAAVLTQRFPPFELLETLRWTREAGCARLQRHLDRLASSAEYFDFEVDIDALRAALQQLDAAALPDPARLRVLVDRSGTWRIEAHPLLWPDLLRPVHLALAHEPVDSNDVFLYHKTTARGVYDHARAAHPGYDDVILWNERGELTETTTANLVLALDGRWLTPPVSSGLLAGALRAELLDTGHIVEQTLGREDLARCQGIYLVNSLRGWRPGVLAG